MQYEGRDQANDAFEAYRSFFTARVAKTSAASIRTLHSQLQSGRVLLGESTLNPRESLLLNRHLRVLERENSREVRRAKPLRLRDIRIIEGNVDMRSAADFLFLLVIRGAYENGVRLGNLLKYAYVDGVTWLTDGSVHLVLDLTKTSAGNSVRLHYHDTGCDWCFCKLLRRHFVAYKLDSMQGDFYLFPTIKIRCRSRLKTMPVDFAHFLSTKWVNNRFTIMHKNGILNELFTGHSMRPGFATDLFAAGSSLEMVKLLGRWSSDTVLIYIRNEYVRTSKRSQEVQRIFHLEKTAKFADSTRVDYQGGGERTCSRKADQPSETRPRSELLKSQLKSLKWRDFPTPIHT